MVTATLRTKLYCCALRSACQLAYALKNITAQAIHTVHHGSLFVTKMNVPTRTATTICRITAIEPATITEVAITTATAIAPLIAPIKDHNRNCRPALMLRIRTIANTKTR
ncbi:hypothetical protein [Chroogloeocystis siderophila]|uniref:Secreted protein n=1 Tax=Chroogloeocystis siderophila 5.2 s.c.1 TaxID=247279 RepID=A0A1U7HQH7_9CHRO|nr:hypothetical protein [Chroogloeocystis siderophila]OKH25819.1 hypothetical protein NIES1031_12545 [Chroogloeocystis siderophila 5.2 s.c.1]